MSFNRPALLSLRERTTYEAWLLEEVYKITDRRIAVEDADEIIYPPTGAPPTQTIYGVGSINLGDWRPGFLNAGAPLILVTAFKLLDMIFRMDTGAERPPSDVSLRAKTERSSRAVAVPAADRVARMASTTTRFALCRR